METLAEFYSNFRQDILAGADANADFIVSEFATSVANSIIDSGEVEGFDFCSYKGRVYGYNVNEDDGILNLFECDFRNREGLELLNKSEVDAVFKRVEKFFSQCLKPDFHTQLEESSPGYGLAYLIYSQRKNFLKVKIILISDGVLSSRIQSIESKSINGYDFSYSIWDMARLHQFETSRGTSEEIKIDFVESFGDGLPCLPAHLETTSYKAYLVVIPGQMLSDIYDKYGAKLLEQNVRCFLQARGNVNKGIRNTILNDPEMFFAYNNGITATAENIEIDTSTGLPKITKLDNLQIVNGGQTSASIYTALKKDKADLSKIFVQMKLSIVDPEKSIEVVPNISLYANSQNKVHAADFSANHPFHIRMEKKSRTDVAPPKEGTFIGTKWFYQRSSGQYMDAQANMSSSEKKKYQIQNPKSQMIDKTDLAKFENAWDSCPYIVSLGKQKNFVYYAREIGKQWSKDEKPFNDLYFRHAIAKAIIFRTTKKLVKEQPWHGGVIENTVVYSIAWIAYKVSQIGKSVNLSKIWQNQEISPSFYKQMEEITRRINEVITDTPPGISIVNEWCKKEACWDKVKSVQIELNSDFLAELISKDEALLDHKDAKKTQKIDNGIESQSKVYDMGSDKWKSAATWGVHEKLLTPDDVGILKIACQMPLKLPNEKQSIRLLEILERLQENGFPA